MTGLQEQSQSKKGTSRNLWGLLLILVLSFVALGSWALASPVGSTPDEDFHLASIWCSSGGLKGMCEGSPTPGNGTMLVAKGLLESQCYAHHAEVSAGCQESTAILHNTELVETVRGNYNGGYPPVFYGFMHLFASENIASSVLAMRLVNSLIFVSLAAVAWLCSPKTSRASQKIFWLISLVPLGIFLLPSINPSSWTIMGIGFSAVGLFGYLVSKETRLKNTGNASVFVAGTLLASGARADGAIYSVLVILTIGIITYNSWRNHIRRIILPIFLIPVALWFYSSGSQASVASQGFGQDIFQDRTDFSVFAVNILTLPDLFVGVFGTWGLGWLDTPMPQSVWAFGAASFVGVVAISWQRMNKVTTLVTAGLLVIMAALPLYVLQRSLAHVGELLQPRYLLPLYVLLGFIALLTFKQGVFNISKFTKSLLVLCLSAANSMALYVNIDRYVHGASIKTGPNLDIGAEWWWNYAPSPMFVFVAGSLAFFAIAFFLISPFNKEESTSINPRFSKK